MSVGVLFMTKTAGYADPSTYLFGNILIISRRDLLFMAILGALTLGLVWRFYPQLKASSFDEEFARVRGVPVEAVSLILLVFIALAIVLLQAIVGIVMVIAMLTLPAGTAGCFSRSLAGMMLGGTILSALFSTAGLCLGWAFDLPVGAMTVIIAGAVFLVASGIRALLRR